MPQQTNNIWKSPLHDCSRCGFSYHLSELVWQNGELVCTEKCWDNPDVFYRTKFIEAVLAQGDELKPDPKLTNPQPGAWEEY